MTWVYTYLHDGPDLRSVSTPPVPYKDKREYLK